MGTLTNSVAYDYCFQLFRTQWLGKAAAADSEFLDSDFYVSNYSELNGSVKEVPTVEKIKSNLPSFQLFRTQWLGKVKDAHKSGKNVTVSFQLFRTQWLGKGALTAFFRGSSQRVSNYSELNGSVKLQQWLLF